MDADFVDGDDVRVLELGGGGGLAAEALDDLLTGKWRCQNHLHGDDAIEGALPGLIDHSHSATRDSLQQLVVAKELH